MKVTKEQSGACEVTLNITVEAEKVDKAILDAYKKIGKNVTLPGFRKGKAPLAILKANLNEEAVMDEAADALMQPAYKEALEETGVEPFAIANVDIKTFEKGKDMEFTAKVPQPPVITLGDYTGIEIDKEPTDVSDEAVEEEVTNFLRRNAKY
ncbi:MAG: trigger factor family protein, partial [Abditibacteriota bacterium]|nr:trigger factor family protein [Abditibacteriota bacterium]